MSPKAQPVPTVSILHNEASIRELIGSVATGLGWRVEAFASYQEVRWRPSALTPSCLVMDTSLSGASGLDLQNSITTTCPHVSIVFVTHDADVAMCARAMKAGAVDFLIMPVRQEALLRALRLAIDRSGGVLGRDAQLRALNADYASLSRRQQAVLGLIVSGFTNKQVGRELGISEITVKVHRAHVMRKMKAQCFVDLIKKCVSISLMQPMGLLQSRMSIYRETQLM